MTLRKINFKSKDEPRGVPSWDIAGFGKSGKLPIRFAGLENSVELDRVTFRLAMDAIKDSGAEYWIENSSSPPPAYIYRFGIASKPQRLFAVAVYPRNKPAQYFMILERMSQKLRDIIERVMRNAQGPSVYRGVSDRGLVNPSSKEIRPDPSGKNDKGKILAGTTPVTRRAGPTHPWRRK